LIFEIVITSSNNVIHRRNFSSDSMVTIKKQGEASHSLYLPYKKSPHTVWFRLIEVLLSITLELNWIH